MSGLPDGCPRTMIYSETYGISMHRMSEVDVPGNVVGEIEVEIHEVGTRDRLRASTAPRGWQPMETAPMDRAVLLWISSWHQGNGGVTVGAFIKDGWFNGMHEVEPSAWMETPYAPFPAHTPLPPAPSHPRGEGV